MRKTNHLLTSSSSNSAYCLTLPRDLWSSSQITGEQTNWGESQIVWRSLKMNEISSEWVTDGIPIQFAFVFLACREIYAQFTRFFAVSKSISLSHESGAWSKLRILETTASKWVDKQQVVKSVKSEIVLKLSLCFGDLPEFTTIQQVVLSVPLLPAEDWGACFVNIVKYSPPRPLAGLVNIL